MEKENISIIDETSSNIDAFVEHLRITGREVNIFNNVNSVVDYISKGNKSDIYVIKERMSGLIENNHFSKKDIDYGKKTGLAISNYIRQHQGNTPRIIIVGGVISNIEELNYRKNIAERYGANDYVDMPVGLSKIMNVIDNI